jgi:hypothetical protein
MPPYVMKELSFFRFVFELVLLGALAAAAVGLSLGARVLAAGVYGCDCGSLAAFVVVPLGPGEAVVF